MDQDSKSAKGNNDRVTTKHLALLNRKLWDLHPDWEEFGNALPVSTTVIRGIKANVPGCKGKRQKLQEALDKWKKKGGKRTWQVIYDALCKMKSKNIADRIKQSYNLDSDVPHEDDGYIQIMTDALVDVIPQWDSFALELGLDNAVVKEIDGDPNIAVKCLSELLQEWIRLKGHEANITCLLKACEKIDKDLANKLRVDKEICDVFPSVRSNPGTTLSPPVVGIEETDLAGMGVQDYTAQIKACIRVRQENEQGIIYVVSTYANGADVDRKNVSETFKRLSFAVFSADVSAPAANLACLMKAASEFQYPYTYKYIAFYYSGHGGRDDSGRAFIRTLDTDRTNPILHIEEHIVRPLKKVQLHRLLFFDCCQAKGEGKPLDKKYHTSSDEGAGDPNRFVLAFSVSEGEEATALSSHGGVWTQALCRELGKQKPLCTVLSNVNGDCNVKKYSQKPLVTFNIDAKFMIKQVRCNVYKDLLEKNKDRLGDIAAELKMDVAKIVEILEQEDCKFPCGNKILDNACRKLKLKKE